MKWEDAKVAPCGTHHLKGDAPAYADRFDEVLKFHAPGLAPVCRGDKAWHIRTDGRPAYPRRFRRTYGFYEGLAAVAAHDGWHHIAPEGADAYSQRYAWCGNFQEGRCAVRQPDGHYLHITTEGAPAYAERWGYAGDFRDGIGVVQAADGRSTHVDTSGRRLHERWFVDLDVFHKGFARARDEDGWLHIDTDGRPAYRRRFAAVEPFYNGQARVERFDEGLEVIDESGATIIELRPALRSEFAALSGDLVGFWRTQTIATAVQLGVFEALPGSATSIAQACGLRPDRTVRLLRALAELSLVARVGEEWHATPRGTYLLADHPLTLARAAREYAQFFTRKWEQLPIALQEGGRWRATDVFGEVAQDKIRCSAHHEMLLSYARHDYADVPAALDLRGDERVLDAGGGLGGLTSALLAHYPNLRVILLDRPEVIALAARINAQGDRLQFLSRDLFEPWSVETDAIILARVLHDWDDPDALRILTHARSTLAAGRLLYIVEMVLPDDGVAGSLCDLHLLMVTGGRERTATEYASLLERSAFEFAGVRRLRALPSVIVGVAR